MLAVTYCAPYEVEVKEVPDPEIREPGDAVVAVELAGLCGSDLHVWHGREVGLDPGTVLGHELVGRVLEVGPEVTRFRPGDRVTSPFTTSCGVCFFCRKGLTCRCACGQLFGWVEGDHGLHGTQAERVRVPLADSTLVAVPDTVSSADALLAGDNLASGWYAAEMAGLGGPGDEAPEPGEESEVVVVLGLGAVGLSAVLAAVERVKRQGGRVFAGDRVSDRVALAARFGAEPLEAATLKQVRDATDGRGADRILEATGSPAVGRMATELLRPGGVLASVGVHTAPKMFFTPHTAYDKNLTYRTGRCPARRLMDPLLERQAGDDPWDLTPLVTHRVPLTDAAEAYGMFADRRDGVIKVVFEV